MSIRVLRAIIQDKGELTSQGFLRVPAYLTRTGVFLYRTQDGKEIRELRHPDDVFDLTSLDSLKMAPLTNDHPKDMVTPENVKKYSVGWIGENVNADNDKISALAIVADKSAQADVDKGKKELSCGYTADLIAESGTYNGEQYDVRQTNIRYNHVALVDQGRAGPMVRLRMDSKDDAIEIENINNPNPIKKENDMKKIVIDGKEVEVSQEVYDSIMAERKANKAKLDAAEEEKKKAEDETEEMKKQKDEAEKEKKAADEEKEKESAKKDSLQARVDSLEEKVNNNDSAEVVNKAVETRIAIESVAKQVGINDTKGKTNSDLMKEVIIAQSPKCDLKDKSDVYVQARFDSISEDIKSIGERRTQLDGKFLPKNDTRNDSDFDSNAARDKSHADAKEGWKQPLAANRK